MRERDVELLSGLGPSRRRLIQLGALSAGGLLLGATAATAAPADTTGAGHDGAAASDPRLRSRAMSPMTAGAAPTSYNGWPVGTPASAIGAQFYTVTATSVSMQVRSGDVACVLMHLAARFNAEVEALQDWEVWGYDYRVDANNSNWWSCHASGTAVDFNAVLHPNGASGTFTAGQVSGIRRILADCGNVIYWGGDFSGIPDEMHFEINVPPGDPQLSALAAQIRGGIPPVQQGRLTSLRSAINGRYVTAEAGGAAALVANRTAIGPWEQFDLISVSSGHVGLRAHANNRFVCADQAGGAPLIANRAAIGPWETFTTVPQPDGTVALRAAVNGRYVTAEHAGAQPLIANRTVVGPWEKFTLLGA